VRLEKSDIPCNHTVNSEVVTETGVSLGWVRGMKESAERGDNFSIIIFFPNQPFLSDWMLSMYELPICEIISSETTHVVAFEDAEKSLNPINIGILEKFGLIKPPWKHSKNSEEDNNYVTATSIISKDIDDEGSNAGIPVLSPKPKSPTNLGLENSEASL